MRVKNAAVSMLAIVALVASSVSVEAKKADVTVTSGLSIRTGASKTIKVKKASGVKVKKITYKSKNKKIASVSKKGKVTGKKEGSTKITVKVKYKKKKKTYTKSYQVKVTVSKKKENSNTEDQSTAGDSTGTVTPAPTAGTATPASTAGTTTATPAPTKDTSSGGTGSSATPTPTKDTTTEEPTPTKDTSSGDENSQDTTISLSKLDSKNAKFTSEISPKSLQESNFCEEENIFPEYDVVPDINETAGEEIEIPENLTVGGFDDVEGDVVINKVLYLKKGYFLIFGKNNTDKTFCADSKMGSGIWAEFKGDNSDYDENLNYTNVNQSWMAVAQQSFVWVLYRHGLNDFVSNTNVKLKSIEVRNPKYVDEVTKDTFHVYRIGNESASDYILKYGNVPMSGAVFGILYYDENHQIVDLSRRELGSGHSEQLERTGFVDELYFSGSAAVESAVEKEVFFMDTELSQEPAEFWDFEKDEEFASKVSYKVYHQKSAGDDEDNGKLIFEVTNNGDSTAGVFFNGVVMDEKGNVKRNTIINGMNYNYCIVSPQSKNYFAVPAGLDDVKYISDIQVQKCVKYTKDYLTEMFAPDKIDVTLTVNEKNNIDVDVQDSNLYGSFGKKHRLVFHVFLCDEVGNVLTTQTSALKDTEQSTLGENVKQAIQAYEKAGNTGKISKYFVTVSGGNQYY